MLYELLTGRRPFSTDDKSPIEWQCDVCERPPTRPSNMVVWPKIAAGSEVAGGSSLEELAARRGGNPNSLRRRLRGDVDRIVLMALRKEPERRYASAKGMADDIDRHFSGHPLLARGDSFVYLAAKFVQRNRLAVGSASAVLTALVAGLLFARRGEQRARAEARHARVEAESFQSVAEFLMDSFLTSALTLDEIELEQRRQRIRTHATRLRRQYEDEDHLRANLLDSLGHVARRLGLVDDARGLIGEPLTIRSKAFGESSLEYALSLRSLGQLEYAQGDLVPAADLLSRALVLHRAHSADEAHTDVAALANDLAACLRGLGRLDEAEVLHREALALRRAEADGSLAVAESLNNLAGIGLDRNDQPEAARLLEESLATRRRTLGAADALTLQSLSSNLALTCWRLDQHERAYALLAEAEAGCRALHVDGEEEPAHVLSNRAAMLIADHTYGDAEANLAEALALQTRRLGPMHPAIAATLARQARLQEEPQRPTEAQSCWQRALAIRRQPSAPPQQLAQALYDYAGFLRGTQVHGEAAAALREAIDVLGSSNAEQAPLMARVEGALGDLLIASKDFDGARPHLERAVSILAALPAG